MAKRAELAPMLLNQIRITRKKEPAEQKELDNNNQSDKPNTTNGQFCYTQYIYHPCTQFVNYIDI